MLPSREAGESLYYEHAVDIMCGTSTPRGLVEHSESQIQHSQLQPMLENQLQAYIRVICSQGGKEHCRTRVKTL